MLRNFLRLTIVDIIQRGEYKIKPPDTELTELIFFSEYKTCLESEIQEKMMDLMGCIPLWFTNVPEQVTLTILIIRNTDVQCGPFNLTTEKRKAAFDLLFDLYYGLYTTQSSKCLLPCITPQYRAYHRSTDANSGQFLHGKFYTQHFNFLSCRLDIHKSYGMT